MNASDHTRSVRFESPADLLDRLDALADVLEADRTDLLVEAVREYVEATVERESFRELVASEHYDDEVDLDAVRDLLGDEEAERLRLLQNSIESDPLDLTEPTDEDIYEGEPVSVDPGPDRPE